MVLRLRAQGLEEGDKHPHMLSCEHRQVLYLIHSLLSKCTVAVQLLHGCHLGMLWVLLYGSLEQQNGVGNVAFLQSFHALRERIRMITQWVVGFKLVLLCATITSAATPTSLLHVTRHKCCPLVNWFQTEEVLNVCIGVHSQTRLFVSVH